VIISTLLDRYVFYLRAPHDRVNFQILMLKSKTDVENYHIDNINITV